jgi:hypothetical protein
MSCILPFCRSPPATVPLPPPIRPAPSPHDYLPQLPMELLELIISNASPSALFFKSLSAVSRRFRSISIYLGLFNHLQVAMPPHTFYTSCLRRCFPSSDGFVLSVTTVTLDAGIFRSGKASRKISELLRLTSNVHTLIIEGVYHTPKPRIKFGRLRHNKHLLKTLTSGLFLRRLRNISLYNLIITQFFVDVIALTPMYCCLSLKECLFRGNRSGRLLVTDPFRATVHTLHVEVLYHCNTQAKLVPLLEQSGITRTLKKVIVSQGILDLIIGAGRFYSVYENFGVNERILKKLERLKDRFELVSIRNSRKDGRVLIEHSR